MTIKELEQRTGMTRANIRFYENEGLLSPRRLENGYRDYSEEDARTLEKIRLLRHLQLDIDTIRKVQGGSLALEQALFLQLNRLEGDRALLERAAAVCRELEQSGVEYAALDPSPWLRQLSEPAKPDLPPPPKAPPVRQEPHYDVPRACYFPWRRLFARGLDVMLYSTLLQFAWLVLSHDQSILSPPLFVNWVLATLTLALTLVLEPLWLHFWGWTPGKWVFGLKLRDERGEKLSLAQLWRRSREVFGGGYAWNIPIANLVMAWKCRRVGLDGLDCAWDAEYGYRYTKEERRVHGGVVYLLAAALCTGLLLLGARLADLPIHRGDLTVAEVSENYGQYYNRLLGADFDRYVPRLDRDGQWEWTAPDSGQTSNVVSETFTVDSGETYRFERVVSGTEVWDQPEFTLENGRVTAVKLRWTTRDTVVYPEVLSRYRETLAWLAMSGAAAGMDYDLRAWAAVLGGERPAWEDWEADFRGLRIRQEVAHSGYAREGAAWNGEEILVCAEEGETCFCEKTVTISLIE